MNIQGIGQQMMPFQPLQTGDMAQMGPGPGQESGPGGVGPPPPPVEFDQVLDDRDTNGDGVVSAQESGMSQDGDGQITAQEHGQYIADTIGSQGSFEFTFNTTSQSNGIMAYQVMSGSFTADMSGNMGQPGAGNFIRIMA